MDSTHIFEPNFQIVSSARRHQPGKKLPEAAAHLLMGILERLRLCHAPRIINARCLTDDAGTGIIRNEA